MVVVPHCYVLNRPRRRRRYVDWGPAPDIIAFASFAAGGKSGGDDDDKLNIAEGKLWGTENRMKNHAHRAASSVVWVQNV